MNLDPTPGTTQPFTQAQEWASKEIQLSIKNWIKSVRTINFCVQIRIYSKLDPVKLII
jgi:hypothetical protein